MMRPSNAHLAYYRQPPGCCCYGGRHPPAMCQAEAILIHGVRCRQSRASSAIMWRPRLPLVD